MKTVLATLLALLLLGSTMVEAGPAINELTLGDLSGPRITKDFRDGVITGTFLVIAASGGTTCPMPMSAKALRILLDAALEAKEVSGDWTVYHAAVYVMVRAGCVAVKEKPDA